MNIYQKIKTFFKDFFKERPSPYIYESKFGEHPIPLDSPPSQQSAPKTKEVSLPSVKLEVYNRELIFVFEPQEWDNEQTIYWIAYPIIQKLNTKYKNRQLNNSVLDMARSDMMMELVNLVQCENIRKNYMGKWTLG